LFLPAFAVITLLAGSARAADAPQGVQEGGPQVGNIVTAPNERVIASGGVLLGLSWGVSIGVAAESSHKGDSHLYVPILGPWLDLGARGGCPPSGSCDTESTNKVLLVTGGVLEAVGALEIVGALLFPEPREALKARPKAYPTTREENTTQEGQGDQGEKKRDKTPSRAALHVSPARLGPGGFGFTAVGEF
jgi:hypothetical protein